MRYVTIADLSKTIRDNIWKIPRDIDIIVAVPRSGMIAASILSGYLNVPLTDINSLLKDIEPSAGKRIKYFEDKHKPSGKALVIDDTVFAGSCMTSVKQKLRDCHKYKFIYACVYLEGIGENVVDLYLEDLRRYTNDINKIVFYEWNIFQHHEGHMKKCLFDMDGVLCLDPPDERNEKEYLDYIKIAKPLFIPRTRIGGIVTYRLEKNKDITEQWLKDNGVTYNELVMFPANTWTERNTSKITPEKYKADFYKTHENYRLFIESNSKQAQAIARLSGKPVFCVEENRLY